MADSHDHKNDTCHDGGNHKSVGSIGLHDAVNNYYESSSRSTDLNTASTEKGNKKSCDDRSVKSLFRTNTRCNCKSNGKW